jgi:phytoene dehydrogenase-like protein
MECEYKCRLANKKYESQGLVTAAYLSKAGYRVLVVEKRYCIGGAAVTEIVDDANLHTLGLQVKMSRASYLAGLLRPTVIEDLDLHDRFKYIPRNPSSFTPTRCYEMSFRKTSTIITILPQA